MGAEGRIKHLSQKNKMSMKINTWQTLSLSDKHTVTCGRPERLKLKKYVVLVFLNPMRGLFSGRVTAELK